MKILILNPNQITKYNWGHQLFRNEIARQHDVVFYGEDFQNFNGEYNVKKIIENNYSSPPDIILTYGGRYSLKYEGLGNVKIPKVHITVDYVREKGIQIQNEKIFSKNKYDLVFGISEYAVGLLKKNKVCDEIYILPFSVDTRIYKQITNIKKEPWVLAAFTSRTDVYPNRTKVRKVLKKSGISIITKRVVHQKFIELINRCKITLTSNNIWKSLSMRYTETLACGGFLLADKPADLELVGLKDGEHLIIYKDMKDLKEKALYYLDPKNEKERQKIAIQGMNFVRKNHSCEQRVKEMTKIIRRVIK